VLNKFVLILFGATGDLAQNKLIPSLFSLFIQNKLPKDFFIYGFARRELNNEDFGNFFPEQKMHIQWNDFSKHLFYQTGNFDEDKGYAELVQHLEALDSKMGECILRIFYLATPPINYPSILSHLEKSRLSEGLGQGTKNLTKIAIEKPFGKDVETSKMLDQKLSEIFEEEQIFRVDHYLGKETIQNLLVFRFANGIFEPIWNKEYIDHVQITWAEQKGIKDRGKFFDGVGILRDAGQNHLMQILAAVAMDMPKSFSKEGVRDARAKAIKTLKFIDPKDVSHQVVRGQYVGYKDEKDVSKDSTTETFVATKFFLDSERFADIPFYMRAGKSLKENLVEVSIVFKQTCHILFKEVGCPEEGNVLKIRIQPNEGIILKIIAKTPGSKLQLAPVDMHFLYKEEFGTQGMDAYEKILTDILTGDQMLFNRSDELQSSWTFIENILKGWENPEVPIYSYEKGSWGPGEADHLLEKDGRKWL